MLIGCKVIGNEKDSNKFFAVIGVDSDAIEFALGWKVELVGSGFDASAVDLMVILLITELYLRNECFMPASCAAFRSTCSL